MGVGDILAEDVRVVITPRSHTIPPSGNVVLDVRCANETKRPITIPSRDEYEIMSSIRSQSSDGVEATSQGSFLDHPDQLIKPNEMIRKQIPVKLDAKSGDVVELYCEFPGRKIKLKSNTIVLKRK